MKPYVYTKTCTGMFIEALFITKSEDNPNIHHKGIDKMWYIHTIEYYSAI